MSTPPGDRDHTPSIDAIPDPVFVIDDLGVLRFVNEAAARLLERDVNELLGESVLELVHPDDANIAMASMATASTKPDGDIIAVRVRADSGRWRQLELRGRREPVGGRPWTTVVGRDTADRHRLGLEGGDTDALRSIVENMNSMVGIVERDGTVRSFNEAVTRLLGYDPDRVHGTGLADLIHPDDRLRVLEASLALAPMESEKIDARFRDLAGDWVTCDFTVKNLCGDPAIDAYLVSGEVATSLTHARQRAEFLTEHDPRTGLLNRDGFQRAAQDLLRDGGGLGLMILDIARFRSINELYGATVGDQVLAAIAERLDAIGGTGTLLSCFGGDEFVMAVGTDDEAAISVLRSRVVDELVQPIAVGDLEIGLAVRSVVAYDPAPDGLDTLLAETSNELKRSKRYADSDSTEIAIDSVAERRDRLDRLRSAIQRGEIQPFFQPIVDVDGRVTALEALVRWVHPDRGVLGVGDFLPLARIAGLAEAIDDHVLGCSLDFATRLVAAGHGHVEVHVNVDPKVIERDAFAARFLERCEASGANPRQMVLELTETDLLAPGATSLQNLSELRRAGTGVAIDDFGTGFSSLSHLLDLPVDGVKIDRSFVAGINVDAAATNLTRAILGLSESLELDCVAEGVEEIGQRDLLAANGCRAFQGWLYSPAVHPDRIMEMLPRIDPAGR